MFQKRDVFETGTARTSKAQQKKIARLAQQFYEKRGRTIGHELDDWLNAESEIGQHDVDLLPHKPVEGYSPYRPPRQIAVGLIGLGAMAGGAMVVVFASRSHDDLMTQHPSMAEQLALTSGYRAILYSPAPRGN